MLTSSLLMPEAIKELAEMFWERQGAAWAKAIPKGLRDSLHDPRDDDEATVKARFDAIQQELAYKEQAEIDEQAARLELNRAKLAAKPELKGTGNKVRVAGNKIDAARRRLDDEFGHTHAVVIASRLYESVGYCRYKHELHPPGTRDRSIELVLTPETGQDMAIACLYSHWVNPDPDGDDLWSFAIITTNPSPEVAATGTISASYRSSPRTSITGCSRPRMI